MELHTLSKSDLLKNCEKLGIIKCKSKPKKELIKLAKAHGMDDKEINDLKL